jgi:cell division protein FtsX
VSSIKRDARLLRQEIEKRLGSIAVHQSTVAQTLEEMRKNVPQQEAAEAESHNAEVDALLLDPDVRKQLQATLQKQVQGWVHERIPALGGRTPIEAVRDPDGKEAVEALLAHWERHDENDVSPNQIRSDISAIRRLLNLADPVS